MKEGQQLIWSSILLQPLKKDQTAWHYPMTIATSAWVTPTWTRKQASLKSWCPALTVDVQVWHTEAQNQLKTSTLRYAHNWPFSLIPHKDILRACSSLPWWWQLWRRTAGSALSASAAMFVAHLRMTWVSSHYHSNKPFLLKPSVNVFKSSFPGPASVLWWLWQRISHVLPQPSHVRPSRRYKQSLLSLTTFTCAPVMWFIFLHNN